MSFVALIQAIFITCLIGGWWRGDPRHDRCAHHEHHKAKVVVAAHDDGHGRLKVRSRNGHTHVKLGSHRHGLEVWTDEKGGSKVRLGDLVVDTDGSD